MEAEIEQQLAQSQTIKKNTSLSTSKRRATAEGIVAWVFDVDRIEEGIYEK
ncbi:MAG: hypothetical protein ACTHM5_08595 [Ginsengibacter sp.]